MYAWIKLKLLFIILWETEVLPICAWIKSLFITEDRDLEGVRKSIISNYCSCWQQSGLSISKLPVCPNGPQCSNRSATLSCLRQPSLLKEVNTITIYTVTRTTEGGQLNEFGTN